MYLKLLGNLRFIELGRLYPSERTIPKKLSATKSVLRRANTFTHPIIVDRATNVILDGTHRAQALRELGFRTVFCQLVDYKSPKIKVGTWYKAVSPKNKTIYIPDSAAEEFRQAGYRVYPRPALKKEQIIRAALSRKPLPPKSNRHVLDVRILQANIPMRWLKLPPRKAQELWDFELGKRLGKDALRLYEESVLVLDDVAFRQRKH